MKQIVHMILNPDTAQFVQHICHDKSLKGSIWNNSMQMKLNGHQQTNTQKMNILYICIVCLVI